MTIRTGSPLLDTSMGGGLPPGVVIVSGAAGSGKTTLSLSMLKEAHIAGVHGAYVATEPVPDADYLRSAAYADLVVSSPQHGEGAAEVAYLLLKKGIRLVVIDSTDYMVPIVEAGLLAGERIYSAQVRLLYHMCSALRSILLRNNATLILVTQTRSNLSRRGKLESSTYGQLNRVVDHSLFLRRVQYETAYGKLDRSLISAKTVYSKQVVSGGELDFYLWADRGMDRSVELLRALRHTELATKRGAYWKYCGRNYGPGYVRAGKLVTPEHYEEMRRDYENNQADC